MPVFEGVPEAQSLVVRYRRLSGDVSRLAQELRWPPGVEHRADSRATPRLAMVVVMYARDPAVEGRLGENCDRGVPYRRWEGRRSPNRVRPSKV